GLWVVQVPVDPQGVAPPGRAGFRAAGPPRAFAYKVRDSHRTNPPSAVTFGPVPFSLTGPLPSFFPAPTPAVNHAPELDIPPGDFLPISRQDKTTFSVGFSVVFGHGLSL